MLPPGFESITRPLWRFHQTLNEAYVPDLYKSDLEFIFDNVVTNGQNKLFKDALIRLQDYVIDYIMQKSGSTSKEVAKKVDALFGNIKISFIKHSGEVIEVVCGQDIARGIVHALKYQRYDVLKNCLKVRFLFTRIYWSVSGMVNELKMDQLFTMEQAPPANAPLTAGNNANVVYIATFMLTGLSCKNTASYADTDKEETIDYNEMPKDV